MNPIPHDHTATLDLGRRLHAEVLDPMKQSFVGKDEIIDLLGLCLVAGENLFILGPPGTAKSALVHAIAARLEGRSFDYLLTRFTEPNELFGPFDLRVQLLRICDPIRARFEPVAVPSCDTLTQRKIEPA